MSKNESIYSKILSHRDIPNIAYKWEDGVISSSCRPDITVDENSFIEVLNQLYLDKQFDKAISWLGEYFHFFKSRYATDFNKRKPSYNLSVGLPVGLSKKILKTMKNHNSTIDIKKVLYSENPRKSIKRYVK